MKKFVFLIVALLAVSLVAAGWGGLDEQNNYIYGGYVKMHYPQMPDLYGWDVDASNESIILADDWQCTEEGNITDMHLWGSWLDDKQGEGEEILGIKLKIYNNAPAVIDADYSYSMPEQVPIWTCELDSDDFYEIYPWPDNRQFSQGWYEPWNGIDEAGNHHYLSQINIDDFSVCADGPFYQHEGEIYWLAVQVTTSDPTARWGWKTSVTQFEDDAVWVSLDQSVEQSDLEWSELHEPEEPFESLDFAFVLTNEPDHTLVIPEFNSLPIIAIIVIVTIALIVVMKKKQ